MSTKFFSRKAAALLAGGLLTLTLPALPAQAVGELPARIAIINPPVSTATYGGIDYGKGAGPKDDRFSKNTWRVVQQTGNCCETFLTTTPSGRLLDFGGSFINYSDDRGRTWRQVQPLTPLINGEGAIVVAPGGDVLGVEWDPYSGDHLQFYKFEADTGQWLYTEMPLHTPFYDREWISVVPGPVTVDGQTYPYISFVKGGAPSKEVWFYSTDGLNYHGITSKALEQGDPIAQLLPTGADPVLDWAQPNSNGGMTALGNGGLLAAPDAAAEWGLFDGAAFAWSSFRFPDNSEPVGRHQVDSAGRIHNVVPAAGGFAYRMSSDGGQTWQDSEVKLPAEHAIEEWDFRANASAGVAAVAIRGGNAATGKDQDLVYKFDITGKAPRLQRMYQVGLGDTDATGGVGNDVRFDFGSVTIFPDGRVAVSFLDSTTVAPSATNPERNGPALAVEGTTTLGGKVPVEPAPPAPELGARYAAYDFDADAQGWITGGSPTWSRSHPGTKDGATEQGAAYGIEGPAEYVDNMNATLTSPPITTDPGWSVLRFWLKLDTEDGFDYVHAQWSSDGQAWHSLGTFTGHAEWTEQLLGFNSPGGPVQVRFRFTSDALCSALTPCAGPLTGARMDEVVVGKQA